jgi:outer membrane protein assembly factor BamD (BamD/ComL family)
MEKAKKVEAQGRLEEALDLCEEVVKKYPQTRGAWQAREMVIKIAPIVREKKAGTMLEKAKQREVERQLEDALSICENLLITYPNTKAAREGRALRKRIELMVEAAKKEQHAAAKMKLIKSLFEEGKTEGAIRQLKKLVKQYPGTPTAKEAEKLIKQYEE